MQTVEILEKARLEGWTDEQVVDRVRGGETALYEILVRRYNQRMYRIARAILRDDTEAEDVMQDAYVRAYQNLHQFEGRSPFSTWLTRIAVHEALARLRFRRRMQQLDESKEEGDTAVPVIEQSLNPEQEASKVELGRLLEEALLELPEQYRSVLMLRHVEEMSTAETAEVLSLSEENVKVRLHRGRALMRRNLIERMGSQAKEAFPFMGTRCDRVTAAVLRRIATAA
jgi:RNA polymerase sigma-70 factor (ECF subfamily)